ncbi:MAG: L,D-transpeptidase [Candidatus Dormibacteria bacterium]
MEAKALPDGSEAAPGRPHSGPGRPLHPRPRTMVVVVLALLVVAVGVDLPLAYLRSSNLGRESGNLRRTWAQDQRQGVSAASLSSLRRRLARVDVQQWWLPNFWVQSQQARIQGLRQLTSQDFTAAVARSRHAAEGYLSDYQQFVSGNTAWLSASSQTRDSTWARQLGRAATPGRLDTLAAQWETDLSQAQAAVKAAQTKAAAAVAVASGPTGLLGEANTLDSIARHDALSQLGVPQDAAALQAALAAGQAGTSQSAVLSTQIDLLRAEIGLNDQTSALAQSVMDQADQAAAEQTPNSSSYLAQYQAAHSQLLGAQTADQLAPVQSTLQTLQQQLQAELAANNCGHTSISGKSIYISLSLQEMIFYDNGCAVQATPVTTGRPQLPTPTGSYSIFDKQSPFEMISPWPPSSPFWYPDSWTTWVMEFDQGGYFIHDAPWEPGGDYGPGSQNNLDAASHGCVHTPGAVMQWAYSWTPLGTPVVITG